MPELDDARRAVPDIDINQPSDARLYDLLLGGKNNYEVDRQLFQELVKIVPEAPQLASENRRWLAEAIGLMIRDGGIGQFLDLGSGLPAMQNTHDIALAADPKAIVVYVDNDLTAISHGQALLADEHSTYFAGADLTDPAAVLRHPVVAEALDLDRPVGIILGLVLHTIADDDQVRRIIADYLAAVPSGSYLAITHPINPRDRFSHAGGGRRTRDRSGRGRAGRCRSGHVVACRGAQPQPHRRRPPPARGTRPQALMANQ